MGALGGCASEELSAGPWVPVEVSYTALQTDVARRYPYADDAQFAAERREAGLDARAYERFADVLSPFGVWIELPGYGHAWVPALLRVGTGFVPYASDGRWTPTEFGWSWSSDWDWGWVPFHYGRWIDVDHYGWCWLPGTTWGPGWVEWRLGGGWVGWAPSPPPGVSIQAAGSARSPWRFTTVAELGARAPSLVPAEAVFALTRAWSNPLLVAAAGTVVQVNAGPTAGLLRAGRPQYGTLPRDPSGYSNRWAPRYGAPSYAGPRFTP